MSDIRAGRGRHSGNGGGRGKPPLAAIPADVQCLGDYERHAEAHIPRDIWRHIQSGDADGRSLAENRAQFARHRLMPRVLTDLRGGGTGISLFGIPHAAPILLAPLAYHQLVHPQGELATVQAATALDTSLIVSTLASVTLEAIAAAARAAATELARTPPPLWFQLYVQPDREATAALVQRAEAAGYRVLVLTVDAAVKKSTLPLPPGVEAANLRGGPRLSQSASVGQAVFGTPLLEAAPTWATLDWLRATTRLPIVVKGILSPEDAKLAVAHGADGIIVSNHGGRILDGLIAPLDALPAIAAAVGREIPLLLDGGIRRGTDILQALALGATAVLVGRPQLHALAVAGIPGVAHMLLMLRTELELAMVHTGCATPAAIGGQVLAPPG